MQVLFNVKLTMAKVSIIVPNYNHAKFLNRRLDSIFAQTYKDFEVILLDDCSQDNSLDILTSYVEKYGAKLVKNEQNSGCVFAQWKKGVSLTQGEYIWIAESDDFASPFFLAAVVPILDEYKNVGLAYAQSWLIDTQGKILGNGECWTNDLKYCERWKTGYVNNGLQEIRNYFIYKNIIPNASGLLFRRSALETAGGIVPPIYRLCGDWLQWIEICAVSDIAFVPQCLNFWRQNSSNARIKMPGTLEWIEGEKVLQRAGEILNLNEYETLKVQHRFLRQCWEWQKNSFIEIK